MINNKSINKFRKALLPFSIIYGLIVFLRNKLYDWGIFCSQRYNTPTLCVGNITVGGTGKTPHTEWLIKELSSRYTLGILSRGYGRMTKGFRWVETTDLANEVGDEPLQMKQKFPKVLFAVSEDRCTGIEQLQEKGVELIILDDAFQHRSVSAKVNVVLMDYNRLPHTDFFLPAGNLRDGMFSLRRADFVFVTKCPELPESKKNAIVKKYSRYQKPLFFSRFKYGELRAFAEERELSILQVKLVFVVTAIASPQPLYDYLEQNGVANIYKMQYADHHCFTEQDVASIYAKWKEKAIENAIVLTTEKDKVKLLPLFEQFDDADFINHAYSLPITVSLDSEKGFLTSLNEKL